MGAYDSREFSKMFSERTEANLQYIYETVKRYEDLEKRKTVLLEQYQDTIDELKSVIDSVRKDASNIASFQQKGKNALKSQLYSIANMLQNGKDHLESNLKAIKSNGSNMRGDELYEVTQLLNSLMGIAVLPFEMHKEIFKKNYQFGEINSCKEEPVAEIRSELKHTVEYKTLFKFILDLHREHKWESTYKRDIAKDGSIKEHEIVFSFLTHLRNTTCHSGDNAMSILPLMGGTVIKEILFYDHYIDKDTNEDNQFGMRLTVDELRKLVCYVADFYKNTKIGYIDKTETIKNAERKVNALLERRLK